MTPNDLKQRKNLLVGLVGGTAISLVGLGLLGLGQPAEMTRSDRKGQPVFSGFLGYQDEIKTIRIVTRDTSYSLRLEDGAWGLVESGGYPVREEQIAPMLSGLATLAWDEPRTSDPQKLDRIGLGAPEENGLGAKISLYLDNGDVAGEIITGRKGEQLYGREPDQAQSWTLLGDLPAVYRRSGWLDLEIIDTRPDVIQSVYLVDSSGEALSLVRDLGGTVRDFQPGPEFQNVELTSRILAGAPALALSRFSPTDVKPASTLETGAIYSHTTITFEALEVQVQAYAEPDGYYVTLRAVEAGLAAEQATSINQRAESWAFRLEPYDWNDFTTPVADLIRPAPQ